MAVLEVNGESFEKEVLQSEKPVVLDLFATWCGPCKMLRPVLEELSNEHSEVKFVSVDVDEEGEIAMKYGVSSIPCLVFLKNGEEVDRSVGFRPKDAIEDMIGELS